MSNRCVAFVDALGMSQALLTDNGSAAQTKLEELINITIKHLDLAKFVTGSNFSDTIALHTNDEKNIGELCHITQKILHDYLG